MGEWMIPTAVAPMANPISNRRSVALGSQRNPGEFAPNSSTVATQAASMKSPSSMPSSTYRAQCSRSASLAVRGMVGVVGEESVIASLRDGIAVDSFLCALTSSP
jgi:hypothetical protein